MIHNEDIRVSDEYMELCQAQLSLLFHDSLVQESAVYLADNYHQEPKLIPILIYPHSTDTAQELLLPSFYDTLSDETVENVWDDTLSAQILIDNQQEQINGEESNQLVLPLIHQDLVFGLLVTTKKNQPWQSPEILKVKKIAQTLAIARFMEEKEQLRQTQYDQLLHIQDLEHRQLDDFLHQLKNPLTAIRTFAKLLLKQILPEQPSYYTSQSIIRESDRLRELISDYSQQWSGHSSGNQLVSLPSSQSTSFFLTEQIEVLTEVNLLEVVIPIIETMKIIAAEKQIEVNSQINSALPPIFSNIKALQEIINNLLENAVKYTPKNGHILITIDVKENKFIELKIADTGYGIPEEDQEKIFARNYRGIQEKSEIQGTGLGLAIVKELCDKIKAKITVKSPYFWQKNQINDGTQFSLFLPVFSEKY